MCFVLFIPRHTLGFVTLVTLDRLVDMEVMLATHQGCDQSYCASWHKEAIAVDTERSQLKYHHKNSDVPVCYNRLVPFCWWCKWCKSMLILMFCWLMMLIVFLLNLLRNTSTASQRPNGYPEISLHYEDGKLRFVASPWCAPTTPVKVMPSISSGHRSHENPVMSRVSVTPC